MKSAKEYRMIAHNEFTKNSNRLILIIFIYFLISGAVGGTFSVISRLSNDIIVSFSSSASILITAPLAYGLIRVVSVNHRGETPEIEYLFSGFKEYGKTLGVTLLSGLFIFLWSLLFFIPGIIAALKYSMAMYILHDHPELSCKECIDESKKLMNGHKGKLFCLQLSYIGWILLIPLTLGILSLWVVPKMQIAVYNFYCDLTSKDTNQNIEELTTEE